MAVKIDNHMRARPHVGLDKADLVYEEPVEGGITRFIAVFQSRDASTIGPVRSARRTDIEVLAEYGRAILAYSGASGYVRAGLNDANLVLMQHGAYGSRWWRNFGRPAPHNLFSDTRSLFAASGGKGATRARARLAFGDLPDAPDGGAWRSGLRARIPFSSSSAWTAAWRYRARSGVYLRSHGSVAHRLANGDRVTARNVIVMRVRTRPGPAGNSTPHLVLTGSGRAVLLRDGLRIVGRWSRSSLERPARFTDSAGRPFVLAPGNTWIELAPTRVRPTYS